MVRMKVKELLQKKGHTKYWLYKRMGLSYQNISKFWMERLKVYALRILRGSVNCWNALRMIFLR